MHTHSGSTAGRWLGAAVFALGMLPMAIVWHRSAPARPAAPLDWTAVDGQPWVSSTAIELQLQPNASADELQSLSQEAGAPVQWDGQEGAEEGIADATLRTPAAADAAVAALSRDGRVEAADHVHFYCEPENLSDATPAAPTGSAEDGPDAKWKPNDPRYGEQWNFRMVNAEDAWEVTQGKGTVVAVIDTGVAYADTRKGKQARDFGTTEFTRGYDFVNHDAFPNDDQGHGTHVAGTIAESTDNNEGVAGLAFKATIMPLKVLSASGTGRSDVIGDAIRWAADHGAKVINMSLGAPFPDRIIGSACEYAHKKGVTIVCAAGNSGREGVGYPAAYKDCIAVSSVGPTGDLAFYSSWGKEVAIAAPGGDKNAGRGDAGGILQNTVLRDADGNLTDDYYSFQGTSMASPHVAAVAAMVESEGVRDPDDVKMVLEKSAQHKSPRDKYGAGVLDAGRAVRLASEIYGDGVARFWMVALLGAGCVLVGRARKRAGSRLGYPVWSTSALAFGLLFPDWISGLVGLGSHYNLIGHSVLLPGLLLLGLGADDRAERSVIGWLALGLTLHVGWEFLRGTAPFGPEIGWWQLAAWSVSNVAAGMGIAISGFAAAGSD